MNETRPFYRRPGWVITAIFLAVVIVGGGIAAIVGVMGKGNDPKPVASGAPSAASSPSSTADAEAASVCGLPGYDKTNKLGTAAPAVDKWNVVGATSVPASKTIGPGRSVDDGVFNTCFAHTTAGAVFASTYFVAELGDNRNSDRLYELLADGAFRDQTKATPVPASAADRYQLAGFKVDQYNGQSATVDLALQYDNQDVGLVSFPLTLVWEHGDWKVNFPDGQFAISPSQLSSLGGYVPFASGE